MGIESFPTPDNSAESENKRWEEMEELGLTPTEWKAMDLFRKITDLENPEELQGARDAIRAEVRAEYEEFGQGDLSAVIDQDADYKFEEALRNEKKSRGQS